MIATGISMLAVAVLEKNVPSVTVAAASTASCTIPPASGTTIASRSSSAVTWRL